MPDNSSQQYKIEKGVPYRGPDRGHGPRVYPWPDLEIGDSFFVSSPHLKLTHDKKLMAALYRARKETHFNLQYEREPGGFRFHRLEGEYQPNKRNRSGNGR